MTSAKVDLLATWMNGVYVGVCFLGLVTHGTFGTTANGVYDTIPLAYEDGVQTRPEAAHGLASTL
jgi:hypothetical protein